MFELNHLLQFYSHEYPGMVFDIIYDPVFMTLKGRIIYKSVQKKFTVFVPNSQEKAAIQHVHTIILDVLSEAGREHA